MINRILIRIKVVQMLYSYLLTRNEFTIDPAPATTSRERKYAYSVYLDMLLLIVELAGYRVKSGADTSSPIDAISNNPLAKSRLAQALQGDPTIRDIILAGRSTVASYDSVLLRIHQAILSSEAFNDYRKKRKPELNDEITFWSVILQTVIAKSPYVVAVAKENVDYTPSGFTRGIAQVVGTLQSFNASRSMLTAARKNLDNSLAKAYELYHALLVLPVALTAEEAQRIDDAKHKNLPTPEDLNPNMRLVNNAYVKAIAEAPAIQEFFKAHPFSWESDYFMLRDLLNAIRASKLYRDYMAAPTTDFAADCEFWRKALKQIILPSDALAEALENRSVYWNDDIDIMGTFATKTIKAIASSPEGAPIEVLPMYKDDEDARFGAELFMYTLDNRETYRSYIDRFINRDQWESERLALMDIIVLTTAIAEMLHFPSIPVGVTVNEYIEIAKSYSTPKSGQFVNGILYSIIEYLHNEGLLLKSITNNK